ncbi:MAG: DNA polymerase I [Deltaproteobacteria bacterium]|nr:DNA polymerase I [Deltaproteobacteria bacterium]
MSNHSDKVYLMDASAFIHRSFHALENMSTRSGVPTGATFGFTNTLLKLLRESRPAYLAVVYDSRGPTRRHKLYEAYKANRPPMDPRLAEQIGTIKDIVSALGLKGLEKQGFEADDIIASLRGSAVSEGRPVVIVSGDKDFYQLLSPTVSMYDPDPKKNSAMTLESFKERFNIEPAAFLEVQALMGDSADNIPGVPKVGEKTALKLISSFGDLDNLYKNLSRVTQTHIRLSLAQNEQSARISRQLALLGEGLEPIATISELRPEAPDLGSLFNIFASLEFYKFTKEIRTSGPSWLDPEIAAKAKNPPAPAPGSPRPPAGKLFGHGDGEYPDPPVPPSDLAEFIVVNSNGGWESLEKALSLASVEGRQLALSIEANEEPQALVGLSLATGPSQAFYVPLGHQAENNQDLGVGKDWLSQRLLGAAPKKATHDSKAFRHALARLFPGHGLPPAGSLWDLTLASYLINPDDRVDLGALAKKYLGLDIQTLAEVAPETKKPSLLAIPAERLAPYSGAKALATLGLEKALSEKLSSEPALERLYSQLELPLAELLARIEETGVLVDPKALGELSDELGKTMEAKAERIYEQAGKRFNLASPKQLAETLFDDLKLPAGKKTAKTSSYSTDNEVLTELALLFPIASDILSYREVFKLKNTYADKLPLAINPATGRVHTTYNQALTATGRLSSSDPNLQNIPAKSEDGQRVRAAFKAQPGWRLLSADYSQIELRIMAHFSGDEALLEAFRNDDDIHAQTAAEIFGLAPGQVTPEARRQAKTINFGIIYGQGPFGLSKQLGIPFNDAKRFIENYFARFPGVLGYMKKTRDEASKNGFVTTWYGRRRYLPGLAMAGPTKRESERMAINTPIQGTAADIIKMAMLKVDRALRAESLKANIIIQVHDELVLEVPEGELEKVRELVSREMASVGQSPVIDGARPLRVSLRVDVADSQAWVHA